MIRSTCMACHRALCRCVTCGGSRASARDPDRATMQKFPSPASSRDARCGSTAQDGRPLLPAILVARREAELSPLSLRTWNVRTGDGPTHQEGSAAALTDSFGNRSAVCAQHGGRGTRGMRQAHDDAAHGVACLQKLGVCARRTYARVRLTYDRRLPTCARAGHAGTVRQRGRSANRRRVDGSRVLACHVCVTAGGRITSPGVSRASQGGRMDRRSWRVTCELRQYGCEITDTRARTP